MEDYDIMTDRFEEIREDIQESDDRDYQERLD